MEFIKNHYKEIIIGVILTTIIISLGLKVNTSFDTTLHKQILEEYLNLVEVTKTLIIEIPLKNLTEEDVQFVLECQKYLEEVDVEKLEEVLKLLS